ncbi:MAG: PEGA domain-containing protein [Polyangiaceae bacterium]|nr:PEGA domain-containing protein [Polyangiaceae bacterium]
MDPRHQNQIVSRYFAALWLGACCCICGIPANARAQIPSAESISEARRDSAKAKYQMGSEAFRERRFVDAVQLFLQADALAPSAALSFNIALAYENLGDERAALRWFRDYLRRNPSAPNAPVVLNRITAMARVLATQGLQQLSVLSTPTGATVLIDRQNVGTTPITLELSPGKHQLHLHLDGYHDENSEVLLSKFEPKDASYVLTLQPRPEKAVSLYTSQPTQTSQPVLKRLGTTPEDRPARRFGDLPWIPTGVGAASLGASLGFELARRSEESKARSAASQVEFKTHLDRMAADKQAARILGGIGGALVITGGVLFVFNTSPDPITRVGFGCGAHGCSMVAKGNF